MQFNSLTFLIFFSLVCLLMALTSTSPFRAMDQARRMRLRHVILLLASYVFYGWWNWACCGLMLGLTLMAHFCALHLAGKHRKLVLTFGIVYHIRMR